MIKFISYDGSYPNLCRGTLKFEKDGIIYEKKYCLVSGGGISPNWSGTYEGPWTIDQSEFPDLNEMELCYLEKLVNENVPLGCCGGCI